MLRLFEMEPKKHMVWDMIRITVLFILYLSEG